MPMTTGSLEPMRRKAGNSWSSVARAVMTRDAWMSVVFSSALRLHTSLPEMMSDGVITPTTAATTCCNPSGISWPAGGMPSYAKTLALLFVGRSIRIAPPLRQHKNFLVLKTFY